MTDYTKDSGTGSIMIRDYGTTVEFWFISGFSSDWYNGLDFNWTANGSTTGRSIDYPTGANWYKVGSVNVNTTQTVTFRLLTNTGVGGIGGPTTLSVSLNRDTVPDPPSRPVLARVGSTSLNVSFTDGSNGGDTINSRQIGYSTSTTGSKTTVSSDRSTTITGLNPGWTYYFWARTHNSVGYSGWSTAASATMLKVPTAPPQPLLSSVTFATVDVSWSPPSSNGGSTIVAYQIGYGTSINAPTTTVKASSPQVVSGLTPGVLYYFFVRAQNSVGWSAWSKPNSAKTVAGAYVMLGNSWKLAIPYVRVGGIWKIAEPWVRYLGEWKRTL